jgi:Ca2+:H+ antiporter
MISCLLLSVVASIEEFAERYTVPKPFIGLILLPIVVSKYQVLFCQVRLSFQSRQMQLSMSLLYGWL